jgi:hypothetical protein
VSAAPVSSNRGPGNDAVDLRADGARYLALDVEDGADRVTAADGFRTVADYSLRGSGCR